MKRGTTRSAKILMGVLSFVALIGLPISLPLLWSADPDVSWNTFLGSANTDYGFAIAVDAAGDIFIAGDADSTWGAPVNPHPGGQGVFVAKLTGDGQLVWNTFMGSSGVNEANDVAVDRGGNVYVVGRSDATWDAPIVAHAGSADAFVLKLDRWGVRQWVTFLGGTGDEYGNALRVSERGGVFVAGHGNSSWGSPLISHSDGIDAFVAELHPDGVLQWHTYLGGTGEDYILALGIGSRENVYVGGHSSASWGSPVVGYTSSFDSFAAKLNGEGVLLWSTFMGGSSFDFSEAAAPDGTGGMFVVGSSSATWGIPVDPHGGGGPDAFVVRFDSAGNRQWNTFAGGGGRDDGKGMTVDGEGSVYLVGPSTATWGSPEHAYAGHLDVFLAKLNGQGFRQWNTFLGTTDYDNGQGVGVNSAGEIQVVGSSESTWGSPILPLNDGIDVFVAELLPSLIFSSSFESATSCDWSAVKDGVSCSGIAATGSLIAVAKSELVDGETFTLSDGFNPSVAYEFDVPGDGVSPSNTAIDVSSDVSATDVRDSILAAVVGSPALDLTAIGCDTSLICLTNNYFGELGNQPISETVAHPGFQTEGMSGGVDPTP